MSELDLSAVVLTVELAGIAVILLLLLTTPLAWWIAFTKSRWKPIVEAVTALPLVLPPTVLGFYLLVLMGPAAPLGGWWVALTGSTLAFSFSGLVFASVLYSLPFVVQPLARSFEANGRQLLEAAATLGSGPVDRFINVVFPVNRNGFLSAAALGFAHTLGEFGVVLMVGGNIPGKTKVLSISIYEHVETLEYTAAHVLSAGLLVFSFLILFAVYLLNRRFPVQAA